jgi:hypothetical protein
MSAADQINLDRAAEWLQAHPGEHQMVNISRGIGLDKAPRGLAKEDGRLYRLMKTDPQMRFEKRTPGKATWTLTPAGKAWRRGSASGTTTRQGPKERPARQSQGGDRVGLIVGANRELAKFHVPEPADDSYAYWATRCGGHEISPKTLVPASSVHSSRRCRAHSCGQWWRKWEGH